MNKGAGIRCYTFLFAALLAVSLHADEGLQHSWDTLIRQLPEGVQSSVLVAKARSGDVLFEKNADRLMVPASTIKAVTAVAALHALGGDFRFSTQMLARKNTGNAATLKGGLVMIFSGDPSLTRVDIDRMVASLKKKGIRTIKGPLWLDGSRFSGYPNAEGVVWNDLSICFGAQSSAMIMDRNCFYAKLKPGNKAGERTVVEYSHPSWPMRLENRITTVSKGQHCQQTAWPSSKADYRLEGCITTDAKPMRLAFAVKQPEDVTRQFVVNRLKHHGIRHEGPVYRGKPDKGYQRVLVEHTSSPLSELLVTMLEKSDNLYADSMLKTLGSVTFGEPGSYETGAKAIYSQMRESIPSLRRSYIEDGSGLSRYNLISANDLQAVLLKAWQQWGEEAPWLKNRKEPRQWLKTGTMKGVNNRVGYAFPEDKEPVIFVVMLNGLSIGRFASMEDQQQLRQSLRAFQQSFVDTLTLQNASQR